MVASRRIRQGDIYWLDDCPPLHGDTAKRRPVVVVSPTPLAGAADPLLVVACTSTALASPAAIELPNRSKTPQTKSGLDRRTWAIPEWWLALPPDRLGDYCGYITGKPLRSLVAAFLAAYDAAKSRRPPPG